MKTSCELEKKLNKLPAFISILDDQYDLKITKSINSWIIEYTDYLDNCWISVEHQSLQAAVDNTLKEIKNL